MMEVERTTPSRSMKLRLWSARNLITRISMAVSTIGMFGMMATTCFDVALRLSINKSFLGVYEVQEAVLMYVTLFGLAYAYGTGQGIIRVEMFYMRLGKKARLAADATVLILILALFAFLAYSAAIATYEDIIIGEYRHGMVHFPLWPLKLSEALSSLLIVTLVSLDIWGMIRREFKSVLEKRGETG